MSKVLFSLIAMTLILGCRQDVGFAPTPTVDNGELGVQPNEPPQAQPPVVRVLQPAQDQIEGVDNQLVFEIIPGDNPINSVECFLDGVQIDCDPDSGVITVTNPGKGPHTVVIVATDSEDLEGEGSDTWTVHDRFLRKNDNIAVKAEEMQSDILFVIDNSGSMAQEQRDMADKISNFINKINGLNWRVGIVTTDPSQFGSNSDGRLVPFSNGDYFLTSALSPGKAKQEFAKNIEQGTDGSGNERGIYAVHRSIERALNPTEIVDKRHKEFFREDAALSVVLISDETETLNSITTGEVLPEIEKSNGDNLINFVRSTWGPNKLFQFNSIITRPGDRNCLESAGLGGTGLHYGVAYDELSRKTGGVVADICSDDYSSSLKLIGQGVAGLQTTYELGCVPQDIDRDGIIDLEVVSKVGKKVPGFVIDGSKLTFDSPLKTGDYGFHYFCLNSI